MAPVKVYDEVIIPEKGTAKFLSCTSGNFCGSKELPEGRSSFRRLIRHANWARVVVGCNSMKRRRRFAHGPIGPVREVIHKRRATILLLHAVAIQRSATVLRFAVPDGNDADRVRVVAGAG